MPDFFTQERFPRLWLTFQDVFGATRAKKRLALKYLDGHKSVVEIGCSLGILAEAFAKIPEVRYLGIDIDPQAIAYAKKRLAKYPNASFSTASMHDLAKSGSRFDYVLFANILHHVDDPTAIDLINQSSQLVAPGGIMVIMEPDTLRPTDTILIRTLYKLERGQFRRPPSELQRLMEEAGVRSSGFASESVSIDTLPWFICGHLLTCKIEYPGSAA